MKRLGGTFAVGGSLLGAAALLLAPALAATSQVPAVKKKPRGAPSFSIGSFTPAVADPRLAAEFARRGLQPQAQAFSFTPPSASNNKSKDVRVAVRARSITPAAAIREPSATAVTALTPTAYNLGLSVGWKGFAISGDVARVQGGPLPGGRETAELGVSYQGKRFAGRVSAGAERADGGVPRITGPEQSYSLDVGGSYSIARNIAVTGGVRYKIDQDRLQPLADERRDSQAVYIGTAFRF